MFRLQLLLSLWVALTLTLIHSAIGVDLTLEPGASGEDVALSVLRRISRTGLFQDDYDLSFRSAYVGTKFFEEPNNNETGAFQGMWMVTEEQLRITQTSEKLVEIRSRIPQLFPQIPNWSQVTWESGELMRPLVNGIAFKMYLETFMENGMYPPWLMLRDQGVFYNERIDSSTSPDRFLELVRELETFGNSRNISCLGYKEIVFVHDGSCTVYPENFTNTKQWMVNLLDTFAFEDVRVGYVVYNTGILAVFGLDSIFTSQEDRRDAILNGSKPDGTYTRTDLGMGLGLEMFKNFSSPGAEGPRIMVVITDGQAVGPLDEVVNGTIDEGLDTFAIGLSRSWVLGELRTMAQYHPERVLRSEFTFGLPQEHLYRTSKALCSVHTRLPLGRVTAGQLVLGDTRYFKYQIDGGDPVTLKIVEVTGRVETYVDFIEPHPSGAVNVAVYSGSVEEVLIPLPAGDIYIALKGLQEDTTFEITLTSA